VCDGFVVCCVMGSGVGGGIRLFECGGICA
jgi:hypothetical protein